ncbi:hypothetical protein HGRIS_010502 [Hohenbuehelia grisea]|uniref:Uncharacterized protein n=1 Tax=Hohenbuehelia grisea TaxID=104357 RepID=A0ABR3IXA1_9AGAR
MTMFLAFWCRTSSSDIKTKIHHTVNTYIPSAAFEALQMRLGELLAQYHASQQTFDLAEGLVGIALDREARKNLEDVVALGEGVQ